MKKSLLAQRRVVNCKGNLDEHGSTPAKDNNRALSSYILHSIGCEGPVLGIFLTGEIHQKAGASAG
jgi:hypothetical protein